MTGELTTLKNVGNTCYINSIIQVLRHTEIMNDMLDNMSPNILNKESATILREWNLLRETMWKQRCVVSPYRFLHYIREGCKTKKVTSNFDQQDVGEFLIILLEEFHDGIKRNVRMDFTGQVRNKKDVLFKEMYKEYKRLYEKSYSEIIDIFYGMQQTVISKLDTKEILCRKIEPIMILNLAIINSEVKTLYDCMNEYCKSEILCGDNKWENEKTGLKEEVSITTKIVLAPKILIISLKKYVSEKQLITFPLDDFNIMDYTVTREDIHYELYGVCNHSGVQSFGHYDSYVKIANKWYCFNDTEVKQIKENNVVSKRAYCLFYKKKT